MKKQIKLAIIGSGKWGMNHVKTAHNLLGNNLIYVCDNNPDSEKKIKDISSGIKFNTCLDDVLGDKNINSVIIATPAETHYGIAMKALSAGKNVLAEKPMTLHSEETTDLMKKADEMKLKLMVGHVLLFHPAIIKLKELIGSGYIGKLQYVYSNRLNLGTIRSEENILWSFAPHDISVIQYLTESNPVKVYAQGGDFLQKGIEDTTMTILEYPDNVHAHIFVSWLHPFKEQRLVVIGDKGMFVFEDSLKSEKLKYYKKGFEKVNGTLQKFESEYDVIQYDDKQPLAEEQKHFFDAVLNDTLPLTDGIHAREVLEILEQAQKSLKNQQ